MVEIYTKEELTDLVIEILEEAGIPYEKRVGGFVFHGLGHSDFYNSKSLTVEEVRSLSGEKVFIQYIGACQGLCNDIVAPYYGKYEQYIQEHNGMLRGCDLPLQYYGVEWIAKLCSSKPVKHGYWLGGYYQENDKWYYTKPWCSVCQAKHEGAEPYCPQCGSKMDLEKPK